jgi:hypothetical protein
MSKIVRRIARYTVGSRQAEHESHRESMEEDDMVKSRAIPRVQRERERDEPMKRTRGLQARGILKGGAKA